MLHVKRMHKILGGVGEYFKGSVHRCHNCTYTFVGFEYCFHVIKLKFKLEIIVYYSENSNWDF